MIDTFARIKLGQALVNAAPKIQLIHDVDYRDALRQTLDHFDDGLFD